MADKEMKNDGQIESPQYPRASDEGLQTSQKRRRGTIANGFHQHHSSNSFLESSSAPQQQHFSRIVSQPICFKGDRFHPHNPPPSELVLAESQRLHSLAGKLRLREIARSQGVAAEQRKSEDEDEANNGSDVDDDDDGEWSEFHFEEECEQGEDALSPQVGDHQEGEEEELTAVDELVERERGE